jgi:hypothetical protein
LTYTIKFALPFYLLFCTGLPSFELASRDSLGVYLALFFAFFAWALVPTLISGDPVEWLKLLPRMVFLVSAVALFERRPQAFNFVAKLIVLYVLSALVQYVLVYWTGAYASLAGPGRFRHMAGPFGMLGNVNSAFALPGARVVIVRLCGFWNEPSNAAGSAFAAFFLARYLVAAGERRIWQLASWACPGAGMLTLSNAGYFALGSGLLFGTLCGFGRWTVRVS